MSLRHCFGIGLFVFSAGCASFQDCEYDAAQKLRSHCAWLRNRCDRCSSNPVSHYSKGWRQGYKDVLMGGDGTCPPVPPHCYWSHKFQNCRGERVIDDWFKGYHDGAGSALASGRGDYHTVPISDVYRMEGGDCLPADDSPYPPGKTTLEVKVLQPEATTSRQSKSQDIQLVSDESRSRKSTLSKLLSTDEIEAEADDEESDDESVNE